YMHDDFSRSCWLWPVDAKSEPFISIRCMPVALCVTLFPYTTLFRSPEAGSHFVRVMVTFINHSGDPQRPDFFCCKLQDSTGLTQDRKSTRLNSSHVKTSYAVFCLKKKILCG